MKHRKKVDNLAGTHEPALFFLTGLPKSGTTWMMNMLNDVPGVICRGEGRFFSSALADVSSLRQGVLDGIESWYEFTAHRKNNWVGLDEEIRTINRQNFITSQALKTELEWDVNQITRLAIKYMMLKNISVDSGCLFIGDKTPTLSAAEFKHLIDTFPDAKIIFLQRNAKDFIVSVLFHYWRSMRENRPDRNLKLLSVEDFFVIDEYLKCDGKGVLPFVRRETAMLLANCWKELDEEVRRVEKKGGGNICFIQYDDLFDNPLEIFTVVVEFLDVQIGESKLDEIALHNSMQSVKKSDNTVLKDHIRSGIAGGWRDYLNKKTVAVIDSIVEYVLL